MHPKVPETGGIFEAFAVEVADARAKARMTNLLKDVLGEGWTIRQFGDRKTDFELTIVGGKLSTRQAWDATYALRALPGVVYAEPLFATSISDNPNWLNEAGGASQPLAAAPGDAHLPESEKPEWSLGVMRVTEAWRRFFPNPSKPPGHGVRIGHPDTGYQDHPEITDAIIASEGYDFLHEDSDAHDDLERPRSVLMPNPGHGTGTSSVIVSATGAQNTYPGGGWVSGVAPGARIVPLRAAHSVILLSGVNLARAIEYAANHRVHVISISLGGFFSWRLRRAISFAHSRGVIICCAAGNYAPFPGWPAAYDEVIACAASNVHGGVWKHGCHGKCVDVTAPGESVWRATVKRRNGKLVYDVGRGSGTSYATTNIAGIAAMWLSYHGFDSLVARYGAGNLAQVFTQILRDSCVKFPGWKEGEYGAGLVDAVRLIETPLPAVTTGSVGVRTPPLSEQSNTDSGQLPTFAHMFADAGSSAHREGAIEQTLSALLMTARSDLPARLLETGQELSFLLATDVKAYRAFEALLARSVESPGAGVAKKDPELDALRMRLAGEASGRLKRQLSKATDDSGIDGDAPAKPARSRVQSTTRRV